MEKEISRRSFLRTSALALGAIALSETKGVRGAIAAEQKQTQVFFTDDISVNGLQKIYFRINREMTGRIGIKLHTGEPRGPQSPCKQRILEGVAGRPVGVRVQKWEDLRAIL
jgi:uncharacterized protein